MMKANGIPIAESTIRNWANTHPQEVSDIRRSKAGEIRDKLLVGIDEDLSAIREANKDAIRRTHAYIKSGQGKDLSGTLKNLSLSFGILSDKSATMKGQPSVIVSDVSGQDVLARLEKYRQQGLVQFTDSTAEEVEPNQLEEGESDSLPE